MVSAERISQILTYLDEFGERATLEKYDTINFETLQRYKRERRHSETRNPKILLLDIETARMIGGFWRLGKQRIGPDQVIKDWFMLGWGCKWLFDAEVMTDFVTSEESIARDDKRIAAHLWQLVDDADIIISHNGLNFDIPKIHTRFILNGLNPPSPFISIDTKKIAYKQFGFSSNCLNFLGKIMLSKEKIHTDYQLWIDCENGNSEALKIMADYCAGDVGLLEEVYLELRPWIKSHPNVGLLMDSTKMCCPNCGGYNIELTDKYYTTPANQYRVVRCRDCGALNRLPGSVVKGAERKQLIRTISR